MYILNPIRDLVNKVILNGGFVNAHSHLDRSYTLTAESLEDSKSHLFEKWKYVDKIKSESSLIDYKTRFRNALQAQEFFNAQAVCSFIDIDPIVHYTALTAAEIVKEEFEHIKLVTACQTLKGVLKPKPRQLLEDVIDSIGIIGSLPGADPGKESDHLDVVMSWAKQTGKRLHVHVDQLNSPQEKETELLARKTIEWGLESRVTAIHSISLACHKKEYRNEVYRICQDADLTFICCPSAWIDHQRTETLTPTHNSITPVEELLENNLRVALGTDNIVDVYKPYCDGDMINEMRLLIDACRIYDEESIINIVVHNGLEVLGQKD
jgi:cytosine/adenosine deaminase-related metal-dependent hydrolase